MSRDTLMPIQPDDTIAPRQPTSIEEVPFWRYELAVDAQQIHEYRERKWPTKKQGCTECPKTTKHECGRLVCGNRKQETARPPVGVPAGGGAIPLRKGQP